MFLYIHILGIRYTLCGTKRTLENERESYIFEDLFRTLLHEVNVSMPSHINSILLLHCCAVVCSYVYIFVLGAGPINILVLNLGIHNQQNFSGFLSP